MNRQEQINALADEPLTEGHWQTVISENEDNTTASIVVLKPSAHGKPGDKLEADDLIYVAHFARPADLRHVMVCLQKFQGMSTEAIETMPASVLELVAARVQLTNSLRDVTEAAAGTDEEWADCREVMRAAHEIRLKVERQRARPN